MSKQIKTEIDANDIYKRVAVIEIENGNIHRKVLAPNDDISNEDIEVQNVCNEAWTDEIKLSWSNFMTEKENYYKNMGNE